MNRSTSNFSRRRTIVHWEEPKRAKMERWVRELGVGGVRLAALGVPLNLMTPDQVFDAEAEAYARRTSMEAN